MHRAPRPSLTEATHIGLVMKSVWRQSGLPAEGLASQTGAGFAYIAAVFSGSRFPSRGFTVRCARACGADHHVLLKVWEDERGRRHHPVEHQQPHSAPARRQFP
ncbi:hypothetical protein [Streptomyces prunicolor]|uniref:hypothetical protein n=1 Tax=Streptomyces prunicolor TaxID=67348 RepID=UPI0033CF3DCE